MLDRLQFVPMRLLQAVPGGLRCDAGGLLHGPPDARRPARIHPGRRPATPERVAALQQQLGLDEPLLEQYLHLPGPPVPRRPGQSLTYQRPVLAAGAGPRPDHPVAAAYALVLSLVISIPLAIAATAPAGCGDATSSCASPWSARACRSSGSASCCSCCFAVKASAVPGRRVRRDLGRAPLLPVPAGADAGDLACRPTIIRSLRASTINVLGVDYVGTARSKGAAGSRCSARHVLRNAAIPTVSIIGVNLGYLVGGSLVIEKVFAIPGLGSLMINAIFARDFPTIQAVALFVAAVRRSSSGSSPTSSTPCSTRGST